MKRIVFNLPNVEELPANKVRSEWNYLLDEFLARINPSRITSGFAPLTHSALAKKLSSSGYGNTTAARNLFKACTQAEHFSKLFWWKLGEGITKLKEQSCSPKSAITAKRKSR